MELDWGNCKSDLLEDNALMKYSVIISSCLSKKLQEANSEKVIKTQKNACEGQRAEEKGAEEEAGYGDV